MSVIEFVGVPCSGKSKFYSKFKFFLEHEHNLVIFNYSDLFYSFSKNLIYLSFTERLYLRAAYFLYKRRQYNNKKIIKNFSRNSFELKDHLKIKVKKIISNKIENIKINITNSFSKKEKNILMILNRSIKNSPLDNEQKKILKSRMLEELIGMHICKKLNLSNYVILNDEGLFQRILSGTGNFKNKDITRIFSDITILKKYFPDIIVLFTNSSFSKIKYRSKKRKEGFKFSNLNDKEIKSWIKIFDKFFQKYKKTKIYKINDKNLSLLLKKITKNK